MTITAEQKKPVGMEFWDSSRVFWFYLSILNPVLPIYAALPSIASRQPMAVPNFLAAGVGLLLGLAVACLMYHCSDWLTVSQKRKMQNNESFRVADYVWIIAVYFILFSLMTLSVVVSHLLVGYFS